VPHLGFYATADDVVAIMELVLRECRVFESYSVPDAPLREFASALDVSGAFTQGGPGGLGLMLYSPSMKGEFIVERFELRPRAIPGKSWRERIGGWGLIQMQLGGVRQGALRPSSTNHNSETRARAWSGTIRELPPVEAWDFQEVTRISRRINRHITGLGVRKDGARPILPGAHALTTAGTVVLAPA
jgi:hypothetical protein